jgi:hypothetical protein
MMYICVYFLHYYYLRQKILRKPPAHMCVCVCERERKREREREREKRARPETENAQKYGNFHTLSSLE